MYYIILEFSESKDRKIKVGFGRIWTFDLGEKDLSWIRKKVDFDLSKQNLMFGYNFHVNICTTLAGWGCVSNTIGPSGVAQV